jgi:hypothetical protein
MILPMIFLMILSVILPMILLVILSVILPKKLPEDFVQIKKSKSNNATYKLIQMINLLRSQF